MDTNANDEGPGADEDVRYFKHGGNPIGEEKGSNSHHRAKEYGEYNSHCRREEQIYAVANGVVERRVDGLDGRPRL